MTATAQEVIKSIQALPRRRTGDVRALRQNLSRQFSTATPAQVLALANALLDENDFVYHFVAIELIHYHPATLAAIRPKHLKLLGRRVDSWYATDTFAPLVAGPAWREGQIPDSVIHAWAKSKNSWQRRTALVCTIALNNKARGGRGDTARTLAVCQLLIHDRDDMVVKAMSWALRELAKRDPQAVERFTKQNAQYLAPRVKREVKNKLTTGVKNPRLKRTA